MKNIILSLLITVCLIFFSGCSNGVEISRESIGVILDANVITTSFNEAIKMQIKTEKMIVIIRGRLPAVNIKEEAFIVTYSTGNRYITWKSSIAQYRQYRVR